MTGLTRVVRRGGYLRHLTDTLLNLLMRIRRSIRL